MIKNLEYLLRTTQCELEKQCDKYLFAVIWGGNTKPIIYKILGLREEEKILKDLIRKAKNNTLNYTPIRLK